MKRSLRIPVLILLATIFLVQISLAQKVSKEKARMVAQNFYVSELTRTKGPKAFTGKIAFKAEDAALVTNSNAADNTEIFCFNVSNGFVIVSGDERVTPILGYGFESNLSADVPPALTWLLREYKEQLKTLGKNSIPNKLWRTLAQNKTVELSEQAANTPESCSVPTRTYYVPQMLYTRWNQTCYYNEQCPVDNASPYCGHVPTGCLSTAMAQIMNYWKYPSQGQYGRSYWDAYYGEQTVNFGTSTYNWNSLPAALTSSNTDVAKLIYHCAVATRTAFGIGGSATTPSMVDYAFYKFFKYSPQAILESRGGYNDTDWNNKIVAELEGNRPIYYAGDDRGIGHGFVIDGYSKHIVSGTSYPTYYHLNWGWGGNHDGWFYINSLNPGQYNWKNHMAIFGLKPAVLETPAPAQPGPIQSACTSITTHSKAEFSIARPTDATSYEWYVSGPADATIQSDYYYASITFPVPGTYTVQVRSYDYTVAGPWRTLNVTVNNTFGFSPEAGLTTLPLENNTLAFPNPAVTSITIGNTTTVPQKIQLVNLFGKVVREEIPNHRSTTINVSDVPSGTYLIKLWVNDEVKTELLQIKH